jgi:CheY-like chemotaxis protein
VTSSPPRVLLVADGGSELGSRRQAIGRAGLDVESAQTGSGAIGLLTARRYAAILTDCDLPDLSALDLLAAIRGVAPSTPLLIYCTSASAGIEDLRSYALDFGAAAVIDQPLSPAQLVEAVGAALGHTG